MLFGNFNDFLLFLSLLPECCCATLTLACGLDWLQLGIGTREVSFRRNIIAKHQAKEETHLFAGSVFTATHAGSTGYKLCSIFKATLPRTKKTAKRVDRLAI